MSYSTLTAYVLGILYYCVMENTLNNAYIEFNIAGTIAVNEADKAAVMSELALLISAFLSHKDVIKIENNIDIIDTLELISYTQDIGEA